MKKTYFSKIENLFRVNYLIFLLVLVCQDVNAQTHDYNNSMFLDGRVENPQYLPQEYQPTILPNISRWRIAHKQLFGNIMGEITVISDETSEYSDLYFTFIEGSDSIYAGKIREDYLDGKLWYVDPDSTNEKLIFDLNLQVNDTFYNWILPGTYMKVDSVYLFEGRKYIEFDATTAWDEPIKFIEGVGPNISLLWAQSNSGFQDPYSVCTYEGEVLVYTNDNPNFLYCEFYPTNIKNNHYKHLKIFPNPTQENLTIKIPDINSDELIIVVLNLAGEVVLKTTTSKNEITLNMSKFCSGIYVLYIIEQDKIVYNHEIIIN